MKQRLVLASGNAGKLAEFQQLLGADWELLPQSAFNVAPVAETGTTFTENALLKARHAAAATGLPALADDSGLAVDALDGAPGVYSARYAGEGADDAANNARLLAALAEVPAARRSARFHCVLALVQAADDPDPLIVEASWPGYIAMAASGSGGFGYDPLFIDQATGLSAAELAPADKNRRSHRGQAARALASRLGEQKR